MIVLMTEQIYFDYAASTPIDERVLTAMLPYLRHDFGNPASATHGYGQVARDAVEQARAQVAVTIGADPREIVWTSGATESNNLALKGVDYAHKRHIITSKTEHRAVLDVCAWLARYGFAGQRIDVTYLDPSPSGQVSVEAVRDAIRSDTAMVSLMAVNNETGVTNQIAEIGALTREQGVLFHVDAAQAIGKVTIDVNAMNIDLLSLASHKVYGPKGVGALYVRRKPRVKLNALIHGGGHERGMRSGTLPTHQIVGMGKAYELAKTDFASDMAHLKLLNQMIVDTVSQHANLTIHGTNRVENILNIGFADADMPHLLTKFDAFAIATGSACSSAESLFSNEPSHVLKAMGVNDAYLLSSLRISFGRMTTQTDVEQLIRCLA